MMGFGAAAGNSRLAEGYSRLAAVTIDTIQYTVSQGVDRWV